MTRGLSLLQPLMRGLFGAEWMLKVPYTSLQQTLQTH